MNNEIFSKMQMDWDNAEQDDFFPDSETCSNCGNELDDCECTDEY